jgi:diguanylate cyclase (GGDEF)-like protein
MLTTAVLLTLVSIMLARSVLQEWATVSAAQLGLQTMELSFQAIRIAEKASFERGPTNAVLGDADQPDPAKRQHLMDARNASDAAFATALQSLAGTTRAQHEAAATQIAHAQDQLNQARQEVDRVAKLTLAERTAGTARTTKTPIEQMFGVIDTTLEAVTLLSTDAERAYPELSLSLAGARLAAELREYAGRVGSKFTAAVAAQVPLGDEERRDIPILIGRIEQLRKMIEVQTRANPAAARVASAIAGMESHYFAIGLPFIADMTAEGLVRGSYGIDTAQFAARYVPEMASIVTLRDTLFDVAREDAAASYAQARHDLAVDAAIGLAVLTIEIGVFLLLRRRVLRPLLANTRAVVKIAEGKLDTPLLPTTRKDEIGDMQNAMAALKKTSQAKHQLEMERENLIEQLKYASSTDFMTGLLNRREFTQRAEQQMALARRQDWSVSLILFDIDHFKSINDQYGHLSGDLTLLKIAGIARHEFRVTDNLARFGGEEFIALLVDSKQEAAVLLAERVRATIASTSFVAFNGQPFGVTASFGLATAKAREIHDMDTFFQLADQALYQAKAGGRNQVSTGETPVADSPFD